MGRKEGLVLKYTGWFRGVRVLAVAVLPSMLGDCEPLGWTWGVFAKKKKECVCASVHENMVHTHTHTHTLLSLHLMSPFHEVREQRNTLLILRPF